MQMMHMSIAARHPGHLGPLFELLQVTALKIEEGGERVHFTDATGTVHFEICHTAGAIPSAAMAHLGIITDDSKLRKRILEGLGKAPFEFVPIMKSRGDKRAIVAGTVRIGLGEIGFEISTPLAHS